MRMLTLVLLLTSSLLTQERYSHIEIPVRTPQEYQRILDLGIAADHFGGKIGTSITLYVSQSELELLQQSGINYSMLIKDWDRFYSEQQRDDIPSLFKTADNVPKYFRYGAMGGFLILSEVQQQLDSMALLFPYLITKKDSIGRTIEGRTIFAVKISDNANTDEPSEPEVLYTALHHAREPQGMMTVIYYMWWLLENYGKDPEATYIVNNRQCWFIPVVNPDGYEYNRALRDTGGGMWRKNRRVNGNGTFGVDLNRNYGIFEMWNASNNGSSTAMGSDTYRGVAPFSEPETFAISQFITKRKIRTCFNYHTWGNYLIYPWGYTSTESADSLLFRHWSFDMSQHNRYSIGTDMQTVQYSTRGNSDDFMYSDSAKERTYAMTPEVGSTGFWPVRSLIYPLAQENILQNKYLAYAAGSLVTLNSFSVSGSTPGKKDLLTIRMINKGLAPSGPLQLTLNAAGGIIQPSLQIPSLSSFQIHENTIPINTAGSSGVFTMTIHDSTGAVLKDSLRFYTETPVIVFNDTASSTALWSTGTGWNTATDLLNSNPYFTDSPNGKYLPNAENSLTLKSPISLAGLQYAELTFRTKWAIESTWDFGVIEVSTNNGIEWTSLRTKFSRKGSGQSGSKQSATLFGYDAFNPGGNWIEQTADLSAYAGKSILIRFRLSSDGGEERDGWSLDDIMVLGYPSSPNSVEPAAVPFTYSLSQNFPNPFNPTTTIQFTVERQGRTVVQIFNALGQALHTIIDQELSPGHYSIIFEAKQLSSGVYFYRFTSGNFVSTKKMSFIQ